MTGSDETLHQWGEVGWSTAQAQTFDGACELVVGYLSEAAPMALWAVTRVANGRQLMLTVHSPGYGIPAGAEFPFQTSMCHPMTSGDAPHIAPDVRSVQQYTVPAAAAAARALQVGSYVGMPIVRPDGELFGTVCGYNPEAGSNSLNALKPLLVLLSGLLSAVLQADTLATTATREAERSRDLYDTDALTGLWNRRGWDRFIAVEEARYRRFGDPASIIVLDLDQLKTVNDTAGHDAGDRLLQRTAKVLKGVTRHGDFLARLGGDEFGLVVVGASGQQTTALLRRLEQELDTAGVQASVGSAEYALTHGLVGAWKAADQAMYQQKRLHRAGPEH